MELDDFQQTDSFGPVSKFEKTVTTPQVVAGDGSLGRSHYEPETNAITAYTIGSYSVKVSKIGGNGWTVTRYKNGELDELTSEYYDDEQDAHSLAREMVEAVSLEHSAQA